MSTFGSRLKQLRISKEMGLKEVGVLIGVSDSSISKYEAGIRTPDPTALVKLADFFEVTVDYLLGRTEEPRIKTIAAHRTDNPMHDLPPEAQERVDEFIDLMRIKYGKKNT